MTRSISSTSDLPVPSDYISSSGDKLRVILTGAKKIQLTAGLDGSILFPELGEINVFGDSLADAKDKSVKLLKYHMWGQRLRLV